MAPMAPRTTTSTRARQRGTTLLESLVGFLVLAAASVAIAQLHRHVQLAADVARERAEAVRLGEEALEQLRAFAAISPASEPSYAAIVSGVVAIDAASAASHTGYRIERAVDENAFAATKATTVTVRWFDRDGAAHAIALHAFIAAHDPLHAGALGLDAGTIPSALRGVRGRAPRVPVTATSLGNGRSAWKPTENGSVAWVFDDRSGAVVAVCEGVAAATPTRALDADALRTCVQGQWLFVAGTLRAGDGAPAMVSSLSPSSFAIAISRGDHREPARPSCAAQARKTVRFDVDGSLHLEDVPLDATPTSRGVSAWQEIGDRFVAWRCIVAASDMDPANSSTVDVVPIGWSIGDSARDGRVCRLASGDGAADSSVAAAAIDANITPSASGDVAAHAGLRVSSFLVVRGSDACPGV